MRMRPKHDRPTFVHGVVSHQQTVIIIALTLFKNIMPSILIIWHSQLHVICTCSSHHLIPKITTFKLIKLSNLKLLSPFPIPKH